MATALLPVMSPVLFTRREAAPMEASVGTGGMIAIGGPPLGGKSLLAARLAECLPNVVRLEAIDDLSRSEPFWVPNVTTGRAARDATAALLAQARKVSRERRREPGTTILVTTRFGTAAERRRAKVAARLAGLRFLFVEARSRDAAALRRIPRAFLTREQLQERLARYTLASKRYRPISRMEALVLPALRLQRVQSSLDEAVERVLAAWRPL